MRANVVEFDPFNYIGSGALKKREDGEPWVSWVRHGDTWGWCAPGELTRLEDRQAPHRMLNVFLAYEKTAFDRVHCCGDGILAIGPLGATFASGKAQSALAQCCSYNRTLFNRIMRAARDATGVSMGHDLWDEDAGRPLTKHRDINRALRLGADSVKWKSKGRGQIQKDRAHLWVSSCAKLLREPAFSVPLVCAWLDTLGAAALRRFWPGAKSMWYYSQERQARWATLLTLCYRYPQLQHYPELLPGDDFRKLADLDSSLGDAFAEDVDRVERIVKGCLL